MNLYKNYNLLFIKKQDIISFERNEQYEEVNFDVLKEKNKLIYIKEGKQYPILA